MYLQKIQMPKIITAKNLLIVALALAWWFKGCGGSAPTPALSHSDTTYLPGDSVPYAVPSAPKIVWRDTGTFKNIFIPADTAALLAMLRNCNTKVAYLDTAKNDTSALIVIADTLQGNAIVGRNLMFQNRRGGMIINNTIVQEKQVYKNRFQLYAGLQLQGNENSFGAGPDVTANFKNGNSLSVNAVYNGQMYYGVKLGKLISLRKRKSP